MQPTVTKTTRRTSLIQVRIQRFIPVKRWRLLRMITRVKDFSQYMPNVRKIEVLEQTRRSAVTRWSVDIDGLPITWKEKDTFDVENFTVTFELIEGDLEQFEGRWVLESEGEGTEVTVEVTARLGIPIIERVVVDILQEKLTRNFDMILDAMEDRFITQKYRDLGLPDRTKPSGFVVMGHPYNLNHLVRYFKFFKPDMKTVSQEFLLKLFELTPSYHSYDIADFRSSTGKSTHGYFVLCPIIPDMLDASPERVFQKVVEGCRIGERLGAGIVTLGGFTSIAGERFQERLRKSIRIPLTTGNAFTVAMAVDGVRKAAPLMGIDLKKAVLTIVGGTGDIGSAVARVLVHDVRELILTGRNKENLNKAKDQLRKISRAKVGISTDNNSAVKKADVVVAAASSSRSLVDIRNFKPGCVICDVGYPKNTSYMTTYRNDLFAFSGGLFELPCEFDMCFNIGLPSTKVLYGCFAEAIILSLEDRYENYSQGKGLITPEQVTAIKDMGEKHGFRLAPFYWGDRLVTEREILSIRSNVRRV